MMLDILMWLMVVVWIWCVWEAWKAPVMPDDYDEKPKKVVKRKRSHGRLGGNLEDAHMRDSKK